MEPGWATSFLQLATVSRTPGSLLLDQIFSLKEAHAKLSLAGFTISASFTTTSNYVAPEKSIDKLRSIQYRAATKRFELSQFNTDHTQGALRTRTSNVCLYGSGVHRLLLSMQDQHRRAWDYHPGIS